MCKLLLSMSSSMLVTLVACAGQLALAMAAAARGAKGPLALPLAILCVDLFVWNFAALASELSGGQSLWFFFDLATSPLTAPLALHFVLAYVGARRQLRGVLVLVYLAFGSLSAVSLLGLVWPWAAAFASSHLWFVSFLAGATPVILGGLGLLFVHLRRLVTNAERTRTWYLLAAFATLSVFGSTELLAGMGFALPKLGNVAALACTSLMAVVALKFNLFERELSAVATLTAAVVGGTAVLVCVAALQWVGGGAGFAVVATAAATFALGAVARQVVSGQQERRRRAEQLSTLGRYSAQMAHDLRNPLAALRGAAEFLFEELERGRPIEQHKDFVRLMLDQVDRVTGVIDEYQRLGRMDPVREALAVNDVVRSVLALQGFAGKGVQVKSELAADLPPCPLDWHLLSGVLENLMRNAFEAMPGGGTLTVRSERGQHGGRDGVVVGVDDTGTGMDARTRERAFDEFYTTKTTGSGLGLAFVRRAVEVHGGSVSLETRPGHGCRFRLFFPVG